MVHCDNKLFTTCLHTQQTTPTLPRTNITSRSRGVQGAPGSRGVATGQFRRVLEYHRTRRYLAAIAHLPLNHGLVTVTGHTRSNKFTRFCWLVNLVRIAGDPRSRRSVDCPWSVAWPGYSYAACKQTDATLPNRTESHGPCAELTWAK